MKIFMLWFLRHSPVTTQHAITIGCAYETHICREECGAVWSREVSISLWNFFRGDVMKRKLSAAIVAASTMLIVSSALAGDPAKPLKGVYKGVLQNVCSESQGGYTPAPYINFIASGYIGTYTDTLISTAVFPGDGTMVESYRGTTVFNGNLYDGAPAIGTFAGTCRYTLTMGPNKSYRSHGSCSGDIPTGPAAGLAATVDDVDSGGQISDDGEVISVGTGEPDSNTLTLNPAGYVAARWCTSSGSYVRVKY
jgi:hypothetical protein